MKLKSKNLLVKWMNMISGLGFANQLLKISLVYDISLQCALSFL